MKLNRHGLPIWISNGVSAGQEREQRIEAQNKVYEGGMVRQILTIRDPEKRQRALRDFHKQTN